MSIYHCSIKMISKGKGQSAVSSAAYRAAEILLDEQTGQVSDFSKKSGIVFSQILLPDEAPKCFTDRQTLWNSVMEIEKAKNAQVAREIELALPVEFNRGQQITVLQNYVKSNFVDNGMCADFSIHDKGDGNPHAHIMLTVRSLLPDGTWAPKSRKIYALDENGEKIYNKAKRQYKCRKENWNDWNDKSNAEIWRMSWADNLNPLLEKLNTETVDHRSFERQGIDNIPTIHEGYIARKIEEQGGVSERCEKNREIQQQNALIQTLILILHKLKDEYEKLRDWVKTKETSPEPEKRLTLQDQIDKARERAKQINQNKTTNINKNKDLER